MDDNRALLQYTAHNTPHTDQAFGFTAMIEHENTYTLRWAAPHLSPGGKSILRRPHDSRVGTRELEAVGLHAGSVYVERGALVIRPSPDALDLPECIIVSIIGVKTNTKQRSQN